MLIQKLIQDIITAVIFAGGFFILIAILKYLVNLPISKQAAIIGGIIGFILTMLVLFAITPTQVHGAEEEVVETCGSFFFACSNLMTALWAFVPLCVIAPITLAIEQAKYRKINPLLDDKQKRLKRESIKAHIRNRAFWVWLVCTVIVVIVSVQYYR